MRLVVDFQSQRISRKSENKARDTANWRYAIASLLLVAVMVIPTLSQWVESQTLVKSLQALILPQQINKEYTSNFNRIAFPTASGSPVTSEFGWRRHPITGDTRSVKPPAYRKFHKGIDFGAATGTPIYAVDAGEVVFADKKGGYGNTVIINHSGGKSTLYGHASQLYVSSGQWVQRGQMIAAVGSTGLSTGPHLHFEVQVNGVAQNPRPYLHKYLANR